MAQKFKQSFYYMTLLTIFWAGLFILFFSVNKSPIIPFSVIYSAGHAAEFGLAGMIILTALIWLPRKIHLILTVIAGAVLTIFIVSDFIVYRQFRLHINGSMLSMFFGSGAGDIFVFPMIMWVQIILLISFLIAFAALLRWVAYKIVSKPLKIKKLLNYAAILMIVCTVAYHITHMWASFKEYNPVTSKISALPVTYPLSANRMFQKMGFKVPERMARFEPSLMNYPLSPVVTNVEKPLPNIIFIALDCWRFDMMDKEITPNIAGIAEKSQQFTKHIANSNHTRHGIFSLFYGLPGGYWDAAVADTISPVLIDTILNNNYEVAIYGSAAITSPEFHKTAFSKVPNLRLNTPGGDNASKKDEIITSEFLEFIENRDQSKPFFSFLFYDAPHAYLYNPEIFTPRFLPDSTKNYLSLPTEQMRIPLLNRYKNAISFDDMLIGHILVSLERKGLLESTIIIFTGDHGEEFNELGLGYWGHNGNYSIYQTQVPMVVYWPGKEPSVNNWQTNHIDIAATFMEEVFGTPAPADNYSTGTNIFNPGDRGYVYMQGDEYAIKYDGIIYIFRKLGTVEIVDENYNPTDKRIPPEVLKDMFEELSRFKK